LCLLEDAKPEVFVGETDDKIILSLCPLKGSALIRQEVCVASAASHSEEPSDSNAKVEEAISDDLRIRPRWWFPLRWNVHTGIVCRRAFVRDKVSFNWFNYSFSLISKEAANL